jgi:hypothetical protein
MGQELSRFGRTRTTSSLVAPGSYRRTETRTIERVRHPDGRIGERIEERIVEGDAPRQITNAGSSIDGETVLGCLVWIVLGIFMVIGFAVT